MENIESTDTVKLDASASGGIDKLSGGIAVEDESISDEKDESTENSILYLTFMVGNDYYGIAVSSVKEAMKYKPVFKTPGTPEYIRGVINLRGEVVPIIDLPSRFYNTRSVVTDSTGIIVIEFKDGEEDTSIGVMIDSVDAVTDILQKDIERSPGIGSRIRPDFIDCIGKVDNRFVILLNIGNVLNIDELSDI